MRGTRNGGGRSVSSRQARVTPTVRTMEIRPLRHIGPDPLPAFIRLTPTCVMRPAATRLAETGTSETTGREAGTTDSGNGRWKTCADHCWPVQISARTTTALRRALRTALHELQDHGVDRKAVAFFGKHRLDGAIAFGTQHVLHFHRFDDRKRLAGFDLLARCHGDRDDQPGHRTQKLFARIHRDFSGHQSGGFGFALRVDEGPGFDAAMEQEEAVEDGTNLHGDRHAIDGPMPYRLAGLPG